MVSLRLSLRAALLAAWVLLVGCGGAIPLTDPFQDARAIAATPDGRLWIVDGGEAAIRVLEGGLEVARIGGAGTGEGAFLDTVDVDTSNGLAVFVADRAAGTVLQFTSELRLALEVVVPDVDPARPVRLPAGAVRDGARGQPLAVAAAPDGVLFVLDAGRRHVLQLSAEGDVERVLGAGLLVEPVDLALADDGTLWVADRARRALQPVDRFGAPGPALEVGNVVSVSAAASGLVVGLEDGVARVRRDLEVGASATVAGPVVGALEVGGAVLVLTPSGVRDVAVD